ncbi:MAG: transcription elongation factor GreA [Anaerolineae bacterium]|nr:MAG: transcription elongation factor GreA [Anaerolineae bacterium]
MEKQYLTPEGAEELRQELARLKGPVRAELARRLKAAIEMGDLSENAEYIATKEEQGFVEGRIQELEHILRNAVIIENNGKRDVVDLGATVTIQEVGYPEQEVYAIVGRQEADPTRGRISNESPIGQALMGRKIGDVVTVETPAGELQLKILKIE